MSSLELIQALAITQGQHTNRFNQVDARLVEMHTEMQAGYRTLVEMLTILIQRDGGTQA